MNEKLQKYKMENEEKSVKAVTKLFKNNLLNEKYLKGFLQEQIDMHLIIAHEFTAMIEKEEDELQEFITKKTARIAVIRDALDRLSNSSLSLGDVRTELSNDNIEDSKK